ncbi:hypothetical protein [Williamsia deligens]|uniref:Uncharacterized protein n=1 Tax=Williamsia deligens TaxID=321325 RepID=A0ABW3G1F7_9NOCA|nr:hypothetical protein [Williamsia deligens]MCP2195102.1 hypothetical protein [Williamsia deligens]
MVMSEDEIQNAIEKAARRSAEGAPPLNESQRRLVRRIWFGIRDRDELESRD